MRFGPQKHEKVIRPGMAHYSFCGRGPQERERDTKNPADAGKERFRACAILTYERTERGRMIQTADQSTPPPADPVSTGGISLS